MVHDACEEKELTFYVPKNGNSWRNSLINHYKREDACDEITVPVVKFSEIIEGFDGVKMDIEGAEMEIIERIESFKGVNKFAFEYHFDKDDSVARYNRIIEKLQKHFDVVKFSPIKPGIEKYTFFPPAKMVFCYNTGGQPIE